MGQEDDVFLWSRPISRVLDAAVRTSPYDPGPVVLLGTADRTRANIMTLSWHTMMEFEPPLVGCVIGGRNKSARAGPAPIANRRQFGWRFLLTCVER